MNDIDYIVPMVFDDDILWQEDFCRYKVDGHDASRWRSWGTEKLHILSVLKNMPFVRTIFILLYGESQIKPWMNDIPKVKVVTHKEFIPEKYMPCFNASTIEMFLHKIPGLSEFFVYGNDDIFPLSPLEETDFFVSGLPCQHHEEEEIPYLLNDFQYMCREELNMIARLFGFHYTDTILSGGHSFSAIRKATCLKVWSLFGREIEKSITPLGRKDCNFNQYLYTYWQHFTGEYVNKAPNRTFLSINLPKERIARLILKKDVGIVCINDNWSENDYNEYVAVVKDALERKIM